MENGINKKGFFDLKVEPHLKPISDLGIGFYNLDENTATLRFQLSNNTGSLLISDNNLSVYGYFESSNGSVSDVIELEIIDELNGIVEITLDQDFLHASTSTKVTGQLYIGVKNVDGRSDYNEVAVLGEFTFEVADALINKISSFTKIEYIKMFSQLKAKIEQDVVDIQEAIANGADYVAEMQTVKEQGIAQINQTVTESKAYIDSVIAQAQTNINDTATSAIGDVNTTKDNAISTMNDKVEESVSNVENVSNDAVIHVDSKLTEFNQAILDNEFVKPEGLNDKLSSLTWQKYKLTQDDGKPTFYTEIDPVTLPPGKYQISYMKNNPFNNSGSAMYNLDIMKGTDNTTQIFAVLSYTGQVFIKNIHKGTDLGWKELTKTQTDTGWITYQLINGALSNTAYKTTDENGFDCAYRTISNGSVVMKKLRINGSNLTPGQVIAQLPVNFAKNTQTFPVKTPNVINNAQVVIKPNGEVSFYVSNSDNSWNETGYAYAELTWHD
ncbi:BppU family phage baseplate upper protein [Mammaliicoccus sciuri]|uniref:BppU family phage baseplate upper protein n=1 Tax=Mammaliicoccus sciuri TaxID=1296 RepID=UPI001FB4138D|nr:BppU family phage baseplate upper protein [Mammaliicoccus sciuri]MCJ1765556.1 BppU family phage baseplate upper protein [Mammaliicoccus sciuri]MCJ1773208.1 BppU family phage baseplate upper protein [Mammaliicoccus sciuri]